MQASQGWQALPSLRPADLGALELPQRPPLELPRPQRPRLALLQHRRRYSELLRILALGCLGPRRPLLRSAPRRLRRRCMERPRPRLQVPSPLGQHQRRLLWEVLGLERQRPSQQGVACLGRHQRWRLVACSVPLRLSRPQGDCSEVLLVSSIKGIGAFVLLTL